jgi:hypothetical protein
MKISKFFNRKKKEEKKVEVVVKQPTELEELELTCGGKDTKVYEALSLPLFLKPPKEYSIKEILEKARQKEGAGYIQDAASDYFQAGRIALLEGDIEHVKTYFGLYQEMTGKKLTILEIPEEAVAIAQLYYQKLLDKTK